MRLPTLEVLTMAPVPVVARIAATSAAMAYQVPLRLTA